ncbi:OsmC family protein [Desulfobacterota bacterium AH_259_B03_O07]|nr:OsmC family protein [Desulfobacterota bacterium AH_259_B03_O07]
MQVKAVWKKNYQVEVKARQFHVDIDEAPEFHGEDTGMMPTELFLCSLASCFCLALVYVAKKKSVVVKDMTVSVMGKKDLTNFKFSELVVEVESSLPSVDLKDIIKIAKKYCYVSNTVSNSCAIEYIDKNSGVRIQNSEEQKNTADY